MKLNDWIRSRKMTLGIRFYELLQSFDENKKEFSGYYYRIKQLDETRYEMARLVPGPCGDFSYHPKMNVELIDDQLTPMTYFDNEVVPTINKEKSVAELEWFNNKCLELIEEFEKVIINI